jgi:thiol:disulfide interchange protein DsbA
MNFRAALLKPVLTLIAIFALSLTACESPEPEQNATPDATETAEAVEVAVDEAEAEVTAEEEAISSVDETEGLEEEAEGEEIELSEPEATTAPAADESTWKYKEGEHYRGMTASQGTSSPPDKIEVAEVFWYGCPHCFNFDPLLQSWKAELPADVAFVRIPVIWNPTNQIHARIMYTAEAIGKLDEIHTAVFEGIHQGFAAYTTEDSIIELFGEHGVDEVEFREVYNSFGVTSAVKRAENLTRRYGIRSVPVLVINGKYVTDAPGVKSFGEMLDITNELVERERQDL